jgi:hypothetical protein
VIRVGPWHARRASDAGAVTCDAATGAHESA